MQVHLFYPDEILKERVPGGPDALGGYIRALQDLIAEHPVVFTKGAIGGRALAVAVAPGGRARAWDVRESGVADAQAQKLFDAAVRRDVPRVEHGPIAFVVQYAEPGPPRDWNFAPQAWIDAASAGGGAADMDAVLEALL